VFKRRNSLINAAAKSDVKPFQDMVTDQAAAANRLLLRADAFCLTDPACPFYGQGNGSVVKVLFSPPSHILLETNSHLGLAHAPRPGNRFSAPRAQLRAGNGLQLTCDAYRSPIGLHPFA
jgi:hypothetical protein